MSNQKLGILAVVAAIMVTWAVVQSRLSNGVKVEPSGPTYLIQGLDPTQIAGITVGTGDKTVKIEQQNGRFVVTNKSSYPADTKQINDLITKCLDIKTSELYTDKPENQADLEVTEAKARSVIKFFKSDQSVLTGVIVGKSLEQGQGTCVRRVGSDNVYLTQDAPWFGSTPMDYVNAEIITAKREDINSVTVTTPDGSYTLHAGLSADDVVMENLPADKKLKKSDAKSVFQALVSLRFDDVNTPSALGELTFDHEYVCRLDDTKEYTLKLAKKDDKTYLKCEASYSDMSPVTVTQGKVESDEVLKEREAKLQAQEFVQRFNLLNKNWVYRIPDWKAGYLTKKPADLLEDEPKETPAKPAQTTSASEPNQPQGSVKEATPPTEPELAPPAPVPAQSSEPNSSPATDPNAPKPAGQ
jgi:hypothetical protein